MTSVTRHDDRYAERLFWRSASPFMRILDARADPRDDGSVHMTVEPSDRLRTSLTDHRLHPLILPGLADDCLSFAIGHQLEDQLGILTLDLWMTHTARIPDGSPLRAVARQTGRNADTATSEILIEDDGGLLMSGAATFLVGRYPSGHEGDRSRAGRFDASRVEGPFENALGLRREGQGASFPGETEAVIGWEGGPCVHGGAVAGLLYAACDQIAPLGQALTTAHVRYLRPSIGTALRAQAQVDMAARRASHLSATALSPDGRQTAQLTAVYAPPDQSHG